MADALQLDQNRPDRQAIVDRLSAELGAMIEAEAAKGGTEEGARMALGAVLGGVRWLGTREGGHAYVERLLGHLHREAVAAIALQDAPAASGALQ